MKTSVAHLPDATRRRIEGIAELLQREAGVIMVILFGSYARGDWVEDPIGGYFSDFDILAIVASPSDASDSALWSRVGVEATKIAGRTTVSLIVHDLKEVNRELRLGQYFFIDILHEGILLYSAKGYDLATPKALGPTARLELGQINFRYWFGSATEFWHSSGYFARRSQLAHAAFVLHQAAERYYHATLLVFTGYKPKTHNLDELAQETEVLHPALANAIPRTDGRDKELFELLRRAYIEARYSKSYRITLEELGILRVRGLAMRVRVACEERLASFCGTGAVGALPNPPGGLVSEELLEPSSFDDAAAFEAWREALEARTFEQGRQAGIVEGREAGIVEGSVAMLTKLLTLN